MIPAPQLPADQSALAHDRDPQFSVDDDCAVAPRGALDEMISRTAGLDGLQGAFDALKTGAEARTVLLPNC